MDLAKLIKEYSEIFIPVATLIGGSIGWFVNHATSVKESKNKDSIEFSKLLLDERQVLMQILAGERDHYSKQIADLRTKLQESEAHNYQHKNK